ncbi:MAG: hypothetical protein ACRDZ8_15160 [Acidimicrobiales bacterium]
MEPGVASAGRSNDVALLSIVDHPESDIETAPATRVSFLVDLRCDVARQALKAGLCREQDRAVVNRSGAENNSLAIHIQDPNASQSRRYLVCDEQFPNGSQCSRSRGDRKVEW